MHRFSAMSVLEAKHNLFGKIMAQEGEGNVINTRKRKSTELIPDCSEEKETNLECSPPPVKIVKPNKDNNATKEVIEEEGSIFTENALENSNFEPILLSQQDNEKEVSDNSECIPQVASNKKSHQAHQIPSDINIPSNADINDSCFTAEADDTISEMNGEKSSNSLSLIIKVQENEIIAVNNTTDLTTVVGSAVQDDLIVLDEIGNTSILRDDDAKPIITLSFASREAFESYGHEFTAFCKKYSEFQVNQDINKFSINIFENHDVHVNNYSAKWNTIDKFDANVNFDINNQQIPSKKKQTKAKKELFTLDATPSISTSGSGCQYTSKFAVINNEPKTEDGNSVKKQNLSACFNCDGAHALRDCPHPKDYHKINQARNCFQKKFQQINRYHDEEGQKYSHIQAGSISAALRNALGLRDNQIPSYVYKMRIYGYPPGWIEEATDHGSSMAVFDIDGKLADTGKGGTRFNAAKIVQYAGFNIKMEKGMRDEYAKNNVPPFSKEHSADAMLKYIRNNESTINDNNEICDMDVDKDAERNNDGDIEQVEVVEEIVEHVSPPGCDDENSSNDTKTSLGDLETQKQQLLAELNDSNSQDNSQDNEPDPKDKELNSVQNTTLEADTTLDTKASCPQEHSTPSNRLKVSEFGTPIIKSASPYSHLPNPENFSVGVSDVINFENLPNSTGAYEKMVGLISRVRETLKSLQDPSST